MAGRILILNDSPDFLADYGQRPRGSPHADNRRAPPCPTALSTPPAFRAARNFWPSSTIRIRLTHLTHYC